MMSTNEHEHELPIREFQDRKVLTGAEFLLRQGHEEGQREMLLTQLEDKFGKLPLEVITAVKALPITGLKELAHRILTAQHLSDLKVGVHDA